LKRLAVYQKIIEMILPYDPQSRMARRKPVNKSFDRAFKKEITTAIRRSLKGSKTPFVSGLKVVYTV